MKACGDRFVSCRRFEAFAPSAARMVWRYGRLKPSFDGVARTKSHVVV